VLQPFTSPPCEFVCRRHSASCAHALQRDYEKHIFKHVCQEKRAGGATGKEQCACKGHHCWICFPRTQRLPRKCAPARLCYISRLLKTLITLTTWPLLVFHMLWKQQSHAMYENTERVGKRHRRMTLCYSHSLPRPVGEIIDKHINKEEVHHCPRANSYLLDGSSARRSRENKHTCCRAKPPLKPHPFDSTCKHTMETQKGLASDIEGWHCATAIHFPALWICLSQTQRLLCTCAPARLWETHI